MKKNNFYLFSIILLYPLALFTNSAEQQRAQLLERIRLQVLQEFEFFFKPGILLQKNPTKAHQLEKKITKKTNQIIEQVFSEPFSTAQERERAALLYAHSDIEELLRKEPKELIKEQIARLRAQDIIPDSFDQAYYKRRLIYDRLRHKIARMIRKREPVHGMYLNLEEVIKEEIYNFFNLPLNPKKEIFEVYPNVQGERNRIFFSDVEKAKRDKFRPSECPVCLEEFLQVKNCARVNLFCGHSLCPTCLASWLHLENKNKCPICQASILKEEFSTNYSDFTKHINFVQIAKDHPHYRNALCRLFGYC